MIDIRIRDLTLMPNDPKAVNWVILSNEEWEKVKLFIETLKKGENNDLP